MYKLKKDSTSARFYTWVWGTDVTKFKTMCPYFWKYVATLLFLPLILVGKLLVYVTPAKDKIEKSVEYVSETKIGKATGKTFDAITSKNKFWDLVGTILKWSFFIALGGYVLFMLIMLIILFIQYPTKGLAAIGIVVLFLGVVLGTVYLFTEDFKNRCIYEYLTRGKMPLEFQSLSHKDKSIIWSGVVKEAEELQKDIIKR